MCFHNSLTATVAEVEKRFEATSEVKQADFQPVYHGNGFDYPTWPVITAQAPQTIQLFRWGLVPRWVKSKEEAEEMRANTLNAKVETLAQKPSFKYALRESQRCLVPSTGFFEWQTVGKQKYPYHIRLRNQPLFAMAGIWESWHNPDFADDVWNTFSIITTEANPMMARIHNTKQRMPLLLLPGSESLWLQSDLDSSALKEIARPLDDSLMESFTIGRLISNRKTDSNVPEVSKPHLYPELSQQQLSLF
ncbi:SOS response-associated peptidase [Runella rosea]|uniref:Abasic site processing protein n=1 Tax=Runella rosea TaxID=2259595 RepID=A0A344TRI0_9BACT|nr:SOS response-associated peptidase [Runella rosea]AXE21251.1 SOS response-associated peptidase [Runella rosea]